jgi:hypothetical protein
MGDESSKLEMGRRSTFGKLHRLAQRESRIWKRDSREGILLLPIEGILALLERHTDSGGSQALEVTVETPYIQTQGAH